MGKIIGTEREIDLNNPKINIVKHSDYMPSDSLPTFNSNAIEIGTGNFIDPAISVKVAEGINSWLDAHGCKSLNEIVGAIE